MIIHRIHTRYIIELRQFRPREIANDVKGEVEITPESVSNEAGDTGLEVDFSQDVPSLKAFTCFGGWVDSCDIVSDGQS
ncbi:hypothetical protein E5D57_007935 [Metarhizium anisopliae]|nr:hypothetical protein E5D57_007935 [Metarhizium anisopliae]